MKFSVIVPTHNPAFLQRALESVYAQVFCDWEIVLVPNGGIDVTNFTLHPRVRVKPYQGSSSIGEVKRFAFSQAQGDVLVELDHDDILLSSCLKKLGEAFDAGADFAYSGFVEFEGDYDDPQARASYDVGYGWRYQALENGLVGHLPFGVTPKALSYIWYAPNHVRAFKRELYERVGGHDVSLPVCDDQDLIARMYLSGASFVPIDECLYAYRVHGQNEWLKRNADIQERTIELRDRYFEPLTIEWSRRQGLNVVDLADLHAVGVPLDDRWPMDDSTVGLLYAHDVLQHVRDKQHVMKEVWRVLAHRGALVSSTPSAQGAGAFMDPRHVSYWVEQSFWYYTRSEQAKFIGNDTYRFQEDVLKTSFPSPWHEQNNIPYVYATLHALKGAESEVGRLPGVIRI